MVLFCVSFPRVDLSWMCLHSQRMLLLALHWGTGRLVLPASRPASAIRAVVGLELRRER
jgi:hypothetical protein